MPELPTGTVTFLFTDIEGSTQRWEQQPDAMQVALARHDTILRQTIEAHGGHVFKTVGDAVCAAFPRAPNALAAALAAQHALAAVPWSTGCELRVRMALHTGVAEERDGDYFGPTVNRVARLLAAGHGGQILLSTATHELVRDHLPDRTVLQDLGDHRLKDLTRPEHIFAAHHPDLPHAFPPLQTLDVHRTNLPVQATPLVGRKHEVGSVLQRVLDPWVRLVTLSGPGGTGKTRLALHLAAELVDRFADGVWFVNLAPITDPAFVAPAIAQKLGISETKGTPLMVTLAAALRAKRVLLLLDNFEQVLQAASLISELLSAASGLKVLVTSRTVLGLYGEHVVLVPPLALPDFAQHLPPEQLTQYEAVRLFIERAQAAKADFKITRETAPVVAEICARLDGLPLAIELAAVRIRVLPLPSLLKRLDHRLQLLTGGSRDRPARQQTLRDAIAWSYSLLTPDEQRLFVRLAVFAAGCTLDAMEAVCNADRALDVLNGVISLVDKSLLRQTQGPAGEARFGMLEMIHEYAREHLTASEEEADIAHQHAIYFLELATQSQSALFGPDQRVWLERLEAELDNFRAALTWALKHRENNLALDLAGQLGLFWAMHGHLQEARRWLEQALAQGSAADTVVRARGLFCLGQVTETLELARLHLTDSLELFRATRNRRGMAYALHRLGVVAMEEGALVQAQTLLDESLALFRSAGDKYGTAMALDMLGANAIDRGNIAIAQRAIHEALALYREVGNERGMAWALVTLGVLAKVAGQPDTAEGYFRQSEERLRALGDTEGVANAFNELGLLMLGQDRIAAAETCLEQSIDLFRQIGADAAAALAQERLSQVQLVQGNSVGAHALVADSLALFHRLGRSDGVAMCLERLAEIALARQQPRRSARLWGAAETRRRELNVPIDQVKVAHYLSLVMQVRSALGEAQFETVRAEGQALSLAQAVAYALDESQLPAP